MDIETEIETLEAKTESETKSKIAINSDKEKLEQTAKAFSKLVEERKYSEARNYFYNLDAKNQGYIKIHKEYKWDLRALAFSSL